MEVAFREATVDDLDDVIALLADDPLGKKREDPSEPVDPRYVAAYEEIQEQRGNRLMVGVADGRVVASFQLVFHPAMSRLGSKRAQLEDVRVVRDLRRSGVGRQLIEYAIAEAEAAGCGLIQLMSSKTRDQAHSFYEYMGFAATHEGFKKYL